MQTTPSALVLCKVHARKQEKRRAKSWSLCLQAASDEAENVWENELKLGFAAIGVSILSLIATLAFGAPPWVNLVGLLCGMTGLFILTKARKGG